MLSCVLHIHNLIILYRSTIQTTQITQKTFQIHFHPHITTTTIDSDLHYSRFCLKITLHLTFVSTGTYLRHDEGSSYGESTIILSHLIYFFNLCSGCCCCYESKFYYYFFPRGIRFVTRTFLKCLC